MNEQRKCFHYTNLRPPWAADNIGLGARNCDLTVGCVRFGANGWNLDKPDLHPGPNLLQRHRCIAEHDDRQWNEQLGVERQFGWRQFERRSWRAAINPQYPMRRRFPHRRLGWLQLNGSAQTPIRPALFFSAVSRLTAVGGGCVPA